MEYDREAMAAKREELDAVAKLVASQNAFGDSKVTQESLNAFVRLSPPVEPEQYTHLITIGGTGYSRGVSRKPGNLLLSWRKLMDLVPDIGVASAGIAGAPIWLTALIGLYVWNKVWRGTEEKLSELEATTIIALWDKRGGRKEISEEVGFERTNEWRASFNFTPLTNSQYREVINCLLKMQCISMKGGVIFLCEGVSVGY